MDLSLSGARLARLARPARLSRSPWAFDVGLATVLAAWSLAEVASGTAHGPRGVATAAALAMSVPLVWRRRRPVLVALVVTAAFFLEARLGVDTRSQVSTMAELPAAAYALGAYAPARAALAVAALQVAVGASTRGVPSASAVLFALVVISAGCGAGFAMRSHRRRSAQLAAAVVEEQQRAHAAVLEERARIARELHDIVAHAVSIMVIQAGGASEVLARDQRSVEDALQSIQSTGRQALGELRRLLAVLRADEEPLTLAPQPGIAQLGELVDQVRLTGLVVALSIDPDLPQMPASMELSVYRIVQESLTNTVKHARATRAEVGITLDRGAIDVRITDDGRGDGSGVRLAARGGGHGLSGIRERVAMYGGSVRTGNGAGGGFTVHASIPVVPMQASA